MEQKPFLANANERTYERSVKQVDVGGTNTTDPTPPPPLPGTSLRRGQGCPVTEPTRASTTAARGGTESVRMVRSRRLSLSAAGPSRYWGIRRKRRTSSWHRFFGGQQPEIGRRGWPLHDLVRRSSVLLSTRNAVDARQDERNPFRKIQRDLCDPKIGSLHFFRSIALMT